MLFDPFIEKLNLPTFSVEFGNGKRIKRRVVGNEPVNNTGSIVFICYHSEGLWVMLSRFITGKSDQFIADNTCLIISSYRAFNCIY